MARARAALTEITGSINWVSDGDTVWLRPDAGQYLGKVQLDKGRVKLRLEAIDAPESCQDWGAEATAALSTRLAQQSVRAQLLHRDPIWALVGAYAFATSAKPGCECLVGGARPRLGLSICQRQSWALCAAAGRGKNCQAWVMELAPAAAA